MAKNIEPKLVKISDYLKLDADTVFVIPEYQRAYSWEVTNCDKLWQDIIDYADSDSKDGYFFGTIIVSCEENDTKYALIDGQQRTTTFLLLLKAFLVKTNEAILKVAQDEDSESLYRGLKERRRKLMSILYKAETEDISDKPNEKKDEEICSKVNILENYSINERYKKELTTILKALDYKKAEETVEKLPRKQKDNKYTNFFRNYKFFYQKAAELSESQLNKVIRTVTDQCEVIEIKSWKVEQAITMFNSLNSDGLPLYDSDIISAKLYAFAEQMGCSDEFKNLWKELLLQVDQLRTERIADIDSILMQHMYYERASKKEIVSESGAINLTTPGLRRYFTQNNEEKLKHPLELCAGMLNLAKIWKKVAEYPIAQVLLKFNENSKLFLASYFYRFKENEITQEDVYDILESMLRLFTILELVDIGYSSKYFKAFLFEQSIQLADPMISVEKIVQDFDEHIQKNWSEEEMKSAIKGYYKNLLVYLNEYLVAKEREIPFQLKAPYDVEHIMPYSGIEISVIRTDAEISDEDEFNEIANQLGNKILLEEKINRAIGNEWFRSKVSTKLSTKTGYVNSIYPSASELVKNYGSKDKPYWTKTDIIKATEEASERIVKFIFGK